MGSQKKQKKGLNRPEECWLTIKGDWGLQRVRDRIRLRLRASCAPFPTSFKPSPKGCRHTMIGWEENAPSCFHSSIRSQSPHLRTGDLNPCNQSWGKISTNKREKQHVSKKNSWTAARISSTTLPSQSTMVTFSSRKTRWQHPYFQTCMYSVTKI